jgi:chromosome segregation ATPase
LKQVDDIVRKIDSTITDKDREILQLRTEISSLQKEMESCKIKEGESNTRLQQLDQLKSERDEYRGELLLAQLKVKSLLPPTIEPIERMRETSPDSIEVLKLD